MTVGARVQISPLLPSHPIQFSREVPVTQAIALAAVQDAIAAQYPHLSIDLVAQVHYIRRDEIAHIDVYGCDDAVTRRAIRADAVRLLQQLGIHVELVGGHDVYTVSPDYFDPTAVMHYRKQLDLIADLEAPNEPSASVLPPFRARRTRRSKQSSRRRCRCCCAWRLQSRTAIMTMTDLSDRRNAMRDDIDLAVMTEQMPARHVYVDLEGINPRIVIDSRDAFIEYANRVLSIIKALHGEFRADPTVRMRGMTFHVDPAAFTPEQRAAARPALRSRLAEAGCSYDEIEQLIGLSEEAETISEYAIMHDDLVPAARIPKPRKRRPPPRSWPLSDDSESNDD